MSTKKREQMFCEVDAEQLKSNINAKGFKLTQVCKLAGYTDSSAITNQLKNWGGDQREYV